MFKILPANLVLEDTVERIYHGSAFAESWHGLFLIRGENVVLLGEIVRVRSAPSPTPHPHPVVFFVPSSRIWIKRKTYPSKRSTTTSLPHITNKKLKTKKNEKKSSRKFCTSRKDSAGRVEKAMATSRVGVIAAPIQSALRTPSLL